MKNLFTLIIFAVPFFRINRGGFNLIQISETLFYYYLI